MSILPLFVYGSLRSGFRHPAYAYISRYFTLVGEGRVLGKLYDAEEYPAAIPSGEDCFITGELYRIKQAEEFSRAIEQLDDYEGLHAEAGEIPLFRREQATVFMKDQTTEMAWIYWYNRDVSGMPLIVSGDVLDKK